MKNNKSLFQRLKNRNKKYNWFQISAYFVILIIEAATNWILNESKLKTKLLTVMWMCVNIYCGAVILSHPIILDYVLLQHAIYAYTGAIVISLLVAPKQSIKFVIELFQNKSSVHSHKKSVVVDMAEYRRKNKKHSKRDHDDDMFYYNRNKKAK